MGSNNFFLKLIADVVLPCYCVNTHMNGPYQQTCKTTALVEVLILHDNQLIKYIWLVTPYALYFF